MEGETEKYYWVSAPLHGVGPKDPKGQSADDLSGSCERRIGFKSVRGRWLWCLDKHCLIESNQQNNNHKQWRLPDLIALVNIEIVSAGK